MRHLAFLILIFMCFRAHATLYSEMSDLERKTVDEGLELYGLVPDEHPEGKIIGHIYIYTKSPFAAEAGILAFLDRLHVNTRESVIRRDLFIKEGVVYDPSLIQDSELVLRRLILVRSMAVIVPVKGDNPTEIGLLVATRDLLSLRPNFDFAINGPVLTNLMVSVGEHNLLGYNKSIAASYELKQAMHIISARYFDPRLFGSRLELTMRPSLVFARDTFHLDGFMGEFRLEKPLISLSEKWGYGMDASLGARPVIDFNGSRVRTYKIASSPELDIERRYRWRYAEGKIGVRRSFGTIYKKEIFASYNINLKRPSIPEDLFLPESAKADFIKNVLPRNELESFITLGVAYFENRFLTLYDYNNFKLQELKPLGPNIKLSNDFAARPVLFSDHNFLRPQIALSYTQGINSDSFVILSTSASNRFDGSWSDNTIKFGLTAVSPKFFKLARVVCDGRLSLALNNRDNQKFALGADTAIRGVESRFYSGSKAFRGNVELRSAPMDIWIFFAGLVFFYDVGAAFEKWHQAQATHTLGLGLRVLAPQVSSELFRIDFGFPIYGVGTAHNTVVPSLGLGQAF